SAGQRARRRAAGDQLSTRDPRGALRNGFPVRSVFAAADLVEPDGGEAGPAEGLSDRLTVRSVDDRFPVRPVQTRWPATERSRSLLLELLPAPTSGLARLQRQVANARHRGLRLLVEWLEDQPGHSWQERWLASGAEDAGDHWAEHLAAWLQTQNRLSD